MKAMMKQEPTATELVQRFFENVWAAKRNLSAIDELMTDDYVLVSAGKMIKGIDAFKDWVGQFQQLMPGAQNEIHDVISDESGTKVVVRWTCSGVSNGIFGLPKNGKQISFTGIAIWQARDGRLSQCWVERSAFELYLEVNGSRVQSNQSVL